MAGAQGFHAMATARGQGGALASMVGPGPTPGSQRFYLSYIYAGDTLDLVAVDPDSGAFQVFPNPVKSEYGAWGMAVGPDGDLYLGTLPHAHLYRLDPRTGAYTDLGRPAPSEEYIWQLAVGSDGKLYGCTYPSAKLVRYDPVSGKSEDLGRMDPTEQYGRFIAASDDGFVYVGIGMSKSHLVAYDIATGQHRDILPLEDSVTGSAQVYRGSDGKVYAQAAGKHFRLEQWNAIPIPDAPPAAPHNHLSDGRTIRVSEHQIAVTNPKTEKTIRYRYGYEGQALPIFRLTIGPDQKLYASTVLPIHFLRLDPGTDTLTDLGGLGGGEFYSLQTVGEKLLMAAYSGRAPLMSYDPALPFDPGTGPGANPELVKFEGQDSAWRPQAMIAGPNDRVYIGAVAGYGKLGGPLAAWDLKTNHVKSFDQIVHDESVVSLTMANGMVVGGTTIGGGGGSHPTETDARLFLWDPQTEQKLFEMIPVPGAGEITDLLTAPDGQVFGIAGGKLFVFDPRERRITHVEPLPFGGIIYNAAAIGPGRLIYGLCSEGIFTINPTTREARILARSPEPITAGFALDGPDLYFASGATFYHYRIGGG